MPKFDDTALQMNAPTPNELRAWRARLGGTQREAAARLLVSERTYQNWEAGNRTPPASIRLAMGAVLYGLPPWRSSG